MKQNLAGDFEYIIKHIKPDIIIHGTHLTEDEIMIVKEKGISIVTCPRSNMWFSTGIPRLNLMLRHHVNLLLGTDNGAWIHPDLWREMETALLISRLLDPQSDYSKEIIKGATINGKIFGANPLIEGKKANFIVIEGERNNILNSRNIYQAIAKRGGVVLFRSPRSDPKYK
ncbi:amidohydrolase family protein [Acidianus sp. RZ1]|nr:amidohydrolase family protein [Acidianus sp. RZ1]